MLAWAASAHKLCCVLGEGGGVFLASVTGTRRPGLREGVWLAAQIGEVRQTLCAGVQQVQDDSHSKQQDSTGYHYFYSVDHHTLQSREG